MSELTDEYLARVEGIAQPIYRSTAEAGKDSKFLVSDLGQWVVRLVEEVRRLRAAEQAHTPTNGDREVPRFAEREKRAKRAWEFFARDEREMSHEFRAGYHQGVIDEARRTAAQEPSAEPTEAMVEAGAREAFFTDDAGGHIRGGYTWDTIPEIGRQNYRTMVRAVLHAALTAAYETKGEGR